MESDSAVSVATLVTEASRRIERRDAEWLLAAILKRDRAWLFAHASDPVHAGVAEAFEDVVRRREAGEPVAYLTGHRGFWTLDLRVTPATLIPRPETETLVEQALARMPEETPLRLLDLGTGSGAIAVAVAVERPHAQVVATDASDAALEVARGNAAQHRARNVSFLQGHWYVPVSGRRFDLITSNPPYIAQDDPHLAQGDVRYEPAGALGSGPDGLDAIREIGAGAPAHLADDGWLLVEHGWEQGQAVRALMRAAGLSTVATHRDLEARERVTSGRKS